MLWKFSVLSVKISGRKKNATRNASVRQMIIAMRSLLYGFEVRCTIMRPTMPITPVQIVLMDVSSMWNAI